MIQVALINRGWCFDNFIIRRIETNRGREAARKSLWIGGTAIILLGAWTLFAPLLKKGKADSSTQRNSHQHFAKWIMPGSSNSSTIGKSMDACLE